MCCLEKSWMGPSLCGHEACGWWTQQGMLLRADNPESISIPIFVWHGHGHIPCLNISVAMHSLLNGFCPLKGGFLSTTGSVYSPPTSCLTDTES